MMMKIPLYRSIIIINEMALRLQYPRPNNTSKLIQNALDSSDIHRHSISPS